MDFELIGESLKSAISIKLGELFNNPYRYKENVTNLRYPNFHIVQTNSNVTPKQTMIESALNTQRRRVQIDYLFNIQYRVAQDTETVTNLRQQLDAVGFKLLTEFTQIQLEGPVYIKNSRYEIADGVLQFFCNITVFATTEPQDDTIMINVNLDEKLKEE